MTTSPATRVAAIADLHLGKDKPGCTPESVTSWVGDVVASATRRGAKALVIAGDLFDRAAQHNPEANVAAAIQLLTNAAEHLPVILVWGNHDVASGLHLQIPDIPGVTVAPTTPITVDVGDAVVAAVSVVKDRDPRRLFADFPPTQQPTLGVLHSGMDFPDGSICLPTTTAELEAVGYQAWVLGHIHQRRKVDAKIPIWYAGVHWKKKLQPAYLMFQVGEQTLVEEVIVPLARTN